MFVIVYGVISLLSGTSNSPAAEKRSNNLPAAYGGQYSVGAGERNDERHSSSSNHDRNSKGINKDNNSQRGGGSGGGGGGGETKDKDHRVDVSSTYCIQLQLGVLEFSALQPCWRVFVLL